LRERRERRKERKVRTTPHLKEKIHRALLDIKIDVRGVGGRGLGKKKGICRKRKQELEESKVHRTEHVEKFIHTGDTSLHTRKNWSLRVDKKGKRQRDSKKYTEERETRTGTNYSYR